MTLYVSAFSANKKGETVSTSPGGRISAVISSEFLSIVLTRVPLRYHGIRRSSGAVVVGVAVLIGGATSIILVVTAK